MALWSIGHYPQTWMAETATYDDHCKRSQILCIYIFFLSFSCFHQNEYNIFHCLEHSMKCWNLFNNLASWNYLVIDKSMEKCHLSNNHKIQGWKLPCLCANSSTVLKHRIFFWAKSVSLQSCSADLSYKSLARNQAAHYAVCLCPIVPIPHPSSCQHCTGVWGFEWRWNFLHSIYAHPTVQLHLPVPTIWFVRGVWSLKMDWSVFFLFLCLGFPMPSSC